MFGNPHIRSNHVNHTSAPCELPSVASSAQGQLQPFHHVGTIYFTRDSQFPWSHGVQGAGIDVLFFCMQKTLTQLHLTEEIHDLGRSSSVRIRIVFRTGLMKLAETPTKASCRNSGNTNKWAKTRSWRETDQSSSEGSYCKSLRFISTKRRVHGKGDLLHLVDIQALFLWRFTT